MVWVWVWVWQYVVGQLEGGVVIRQAMDHTRSEGRGTTTAGRLLLGAERLS